MFKKALAALATTALIAGGLAVTPSQAARRAAAKPMTSSVMLESVGSSGVVGTATLTYNASSGMTTVKITVKHLEAGSSHPAHIHTGQCGSNGPVVAALSNVKAGMNGIGTSTTVVKGSFAHKADYINVHYGPGLNLTQFTVISCANLM